MSIRNTLGSLEARKKNILEDHMLQDVLDAEKSDIVNALDIDEPEHRGVYGFTVTPKRPGVAALMGGNPIDEELRRLMKIKRERIL